MDFDLSDDQLALRDAASTLVAQQASRDRVRAHVGSGVVVGSARESAPRGFDAQLWKSMADQGWTAVERPESDGGLGMGMVEVAILAEVLGSHVAPAPWLQSVLALGALSKAGSDVDPQLLEALASGEAVGCIADARHPASIEVTRRDGTTRLTGTPDPVVYGPSSRVAVVLTDDKLFSVDLSESGSSPDARPEPEPAMDRTRELGWLKLDGTPVIEIGGPDEARELLDRAATAMSAELLGVASRALDMAVEYAKARVQFGKPIGSFQAIKHMLADALVDVEGMRSTTYYAAWCCAAGDAESSLAASMAKAWCSDAAGRVAATTLQVHGGIGFTWEHDMHLYVKRSQLDQVSFGDAPFHRDRIASILREKVDAGLAVI